MARKVSTKQLTAQILHPNDPDIWVKARKLSTAEAIDFFGDLAQKGRPVAIRDNDGALVRNPKTGRLEVENQNVFNSKLVLEFLSLVVEDWGGILDEAGNPIPYSPKSLELLLDESLDVVLDEFEPEREGDDGVRPFWRYLMDEVGKKETFDSDPKANASASR